MIFTEDSHVHIKMSLEFLFKKRPLYLYPEGHELRIFYLYMKYLYKLGHNIIKII